MVEILGFIAAFCTTVSFLPQAIKIIRTRNTDGISLWMYIIFSLGLVCWLGYGLLTDNTPVIAANAVTLVLSLTILGMKIRT
ncbi:MAG: glutathione synthetase [Alphaproteobacteria bacterium]|nr:glutathione synthetase [Alphaproteobacteria bacterium]